MKVIEYPAREDWVKILTRPSLDVAKLQETVNTVLNKVRYGGDAAVKEYELLFDKVRLDSLAVNEDEMMEADCLVDDSLKSAIELAHENIAKFLSAQKFQTKKIDVQSGVT